jgi:hypothetical protein
VLPRKSQLADLASTVFCAAFGLIVCAQLLPGASMNRRGFLIALGIISLPQCGLGLYLDRPAGTYTGRLGRFGFGIFLLCVWIFAGPAVADWATPDFNIGGLWQYIVLVGVLFAVGFAVWRIVQLGTRMTTHVR